MTTQSWGFRKPREKGAPTVEITVELRDGEDHLGAYADDAYYYGDLTKEESLALARAVLAKLDPPPFEPGDHVWVVDGPMCGCNGFVLGTVRESGHVIVSCSTGARSEILLQPIRFVRKRT
jgi:hypothetical protein